MIRHAFLVALVPFLIGAAEPSAPAEDAIGKCSGSHRITCVVDGDTLWLAGTKVRVADINTPETFRAACPREARLGARATDRFIELLNEAPFEVRAAGSRDEDFYGRKPRIVVRQGESLGDILVREGLAEKWQGRRGNWCTA